MQENNSQNANLILNKLKKALKITTDIQLSEFLNIKPNTISSWKKRNTLDYSSIISICGLYEIDLNEIFLNQENSKQIHNSYVSETPLVNREVQFQYCIGSEGLLEGLPKYHFPFIKGNNTRAFQVLSNNMSPVINENSYAICESAEVESIPDFSLVVIISRTKGFFINRISKNPLKQSDYILSSENSLMETISINISDIDELWLVKGIMSYSISSISKMNNNTKKKKNS